MPRVIVNVDSMRSDVLVNREMFYTAVSRSRLDMQLYTDDVDALRRSVARENRKDIALDYVKQPALQQRLQQSTGMTMGF